VICGVVEVAELDLGHRRERDVVKEGPRSELSETEESGMPFIGQRGGHRGWSGAAEHHGLG
jgi:hypothetical protein